MNGESGVSGVEAKRGRVDVDLDKSGMGVPFRWRTEVQDPVETGAEEEDNICFFEGGTAGAGGVQGV